jgi:hypothetical protein
LYSGVGIEHRLVITLLKGAPCGEPASLLLAATLKGTPWQSGRATTANSASRVERILDLDLGAAFRGDAHVFEIYFQNSLVKTLHLVTLE